jgi:hypothetical protein
MKLPLALLAALVSGAALAQTDIEAIERGTVIPSLRFSFDIAGEASPEGPAVPHSGHGIELGLSGGSGKDDQSLAGGERVVFGGRTFTSASPTLQHDFDFRFFEVAYRYRRFFGSGVFGIEALGGLGFASLELTTSSATQSASEKLSSGGLVGGFGIVWKFLPAASLQSRFTLFASGDEEGVTAAARLDVNVAYAFARNVAVRGGLVSWGIGSARADANNSGSFNSRIGAGLSGLSIGLDVAF